MSTTRRLGGGAALAASASLLLGAAAPATAGGLHVRHGHCSGSATWEMEVYRDDGKLDVELEIDTHRAARAWRVKLMQNGTTFYSAQRATNGSGVIVLDRLRPDRAGTDTFTFRATQLSNGQVCKGSITF